MKVAVMFVAAVLVMVMMGDGGGDVGNNVVVKVCGYVCVCVCVGGGGGCVHACVRACKRANVGMGLSVGDDDERTILARVGQQPGGRGGGGVEDGRAGHHELPVSPPASPLSGLPGTARHGTARHGTARHGTARHAMVLSPLPYTVLHTPNTRGLRWWWL